MGAALEHLAVIAAFALEDRTRVMQRMGQDMHIGIAPVDQLAIHPDLAIAITIARHVPSPLRTFSFVARNMSAPDIKLREICDSLPVCPWNVNKADLI